MEARPISFALAFAVLGPGCMDDDNGLEATSSAAQSITNGTLDTGDSAVVALVIQGHAQCTGTLVAPDVVLTAAHCASPVPEVFFGTALEAGGHVAEVSEVIVHPGFRRVDVATYQDDVALLVLAEAPGYSPLPVLQTPIDPSFMGASLRLVGFGHAAPDDMSGHLKRTGYASLSAFDERTITFQSAPSQTCVGDSGGPALLAIDGVEHVVGVATSGDPACAAFGISARADAYFADFIAPNTNDSGGCSAVPGTREPAWFSLLLACAAVVVITRRRPHRERARRGISTSHGGSGG